MEITTCTICSKTKTALACDSCGDTSCKHCCYFIDENCFEFLNLLPEKLQDKAFCPTCYFSEIAEVIEEHQDFLLQARDINVYDKEQGKETRRMRRLADPIEITDCDDKEATLMQLAFLAAKGGHNTLVDVDLKYEKVTISGAYKTLNWSGTAVPITLDR